MLHGGFEGDVALLAPMLPLQADLAVLFLALGAGQTVSLLLQYLPAVRSRTKLVRRVHLLLILVFKVCKSLLFAGV